MYVLIPLLGIVIYFGFIQRANDEPIEAPDTRLTFEEFILAYNAIFSGIADMEITEWTVTPDGSINIIGDGHGFTIAMHDNPPHYLRSIIFLFQNTDMVDILHNMLKKLALIAVTEPSIAEADRQSFLTLVMQAGDNGVITQRGTLYSYFVVNNTGILTIDF